MIVIDDLNDWLGCMGHPVARTPAIDRLAARGTLFANAHCQASLCGPSRTSVMTGLRPSSTGVYGLEPWFRRADGLADVVTLPQYLKRHGRYTTYTTGKVYHHSAKRGRYKGEFDVSGPGFDPGPFPRQKLVDTPTDNPWVDWGTFPHRDEDKGDWKVADWAVRTLRDRPAEPFFLSVGFFLPHVPSYATPKWFDLVLDDDSVLPEILPGDRDDTPRFSWYLHWSLPEPRRDFLERTGQWRNLCRSYLACTSFVDSQVGRLLDALEESGLAEDTVVVLWSDHGWHLGEKRVTGKNTLWERATRVPLIFAGPGIASGEIVTSPAELLDIYPTLTDLAGLPRNATVEGLSLAPQLRDADAPRDRPAITTHNRDNHAVRSSGFRYIRYADGSEELYDVEADPREWANLAGDSSYAEVVAEHRRWLPTINRPPVPRSRFRVLTVDENRPVWEGEVIPEGASVPGLEPARDSGE